MSDASPPDLSAAARPSPELVLIRTVAEAVISTVGRKRGERFLRQWMALVATEESVAALLPIRPARDRSAEARAREQAAAWLRQVAPTLIAALPEE